MFSIWVDPEQAVQARKLKYLILRNTNSCTNVLGLFFSTKILNKMFSISVDPEQAVLPTTFVQEVVLRKIKYLNV